MKKLTKLIVAVLVVAVLALSLVGCGGGGGGDKIKIGFLGCMSGVDSYLGQTAKLALEDRIAEINEAGGLIGKQVELIVYDIGLDPVPETIQAATRLIEQDKVCAIIGPESSSEAIAVVEIIQAGQVPMLVTTASNETVTVREDGGLNDFMFRMCFIDSYQGEALADYVYNKMGLRKIAVLGDVNNLYTQGIQEFFISEFEGLGGEITSIEGFTDVDTEFRAPLQNIKNSDAEGILIATGTYKIAGFIGQQAKELDMDLQILGVDGWYAKEIIDFAGAELNGAIMSNTMQDDDPQFADYAAAFAEKHPGQTVNVFAYYALDALACIEWAITTSGSAEPVTIKETLETMSNVPVFTTDSFTIDPETHNPLNRPIVILEITPDGFKTLETFVPGA